MDKKKDSSECKEEYKEEISMKQSTSTSSKNKKSKKLRKKVGHANTLLAEVINNQFEHDKQIRPEPSLPMKFEQEPQNTEPHKDVIPSQIPESVDTTQIRTEKFVEKLEKNELIGEIDIDNQLENDKQVIGFKKYLEEEGDQIQKIDDQNKYCMDNSNNSDLVFIEDFEYEEESYIATSNRKNNRNLNENILNDREQNQFSMSEYKKTTILDHNFNGDDSHVKKELDETIKQVFEFMQSQTPDKLKILKKFEKVLKKFIFDYRFDSNHEPRRYKSQQSLEKNLMIKFRDPKFDERQISYTISDLRHNPYSLFANDIDVYVHILSNEILFLLFILEKQKCIKESYYRELEEYLKAALQDSFDVSSNYLTEKRIYHQCILLTKGRNREKKMNIRIRISYQLTNVFVYRDQIISRFHNKNSNELNIFVSFVLYWAQKRKILSKQCIEKNAWINLIIFFFQINKRLPPSTNYDLLTFNAKIVEKKCYESQATPISNNPPNESRRADKNVGIHSSSRVPSKLFDLNRFAKLNIGKEFVLTQQKGFQQQEYKQFEFQAYKILPLISPCNAPIYSVVEPPTFNYGYFFYKFIYFLHTQIVISPLAISISGEVLFKKSKNYAIIEPLAIQDSVWTNINLVEHLAYQLDAFEYLMEQIKITFDTITQKDSSVVYLTDIPEPCFLNLSLKNK